MVYWIDRLKNNKEEQSGVKNSLKTYLNRTLLDIEKLTNSEDYNVLLKCPS